MYSADLDGLSLDLKLYLDCDYLSKHEKNNYAYTSIEKVYTLSMNSQAYKNFSLQNKSVIQRYKFFKTRLKDLRQRKLPFRAIDVYHQCAKKNLAIFMQNRHVIQEKSLETLVENALPFESSLRLLEKINWLHGTNSSLLAMLPYTDYSLMPTGQLLALGVAPMGGEIILGGMRKEGTNQARLSVETIRNFPRCWTYALNPDHHFDFQRYADVEMLFEDSLKNFAALSPDSDSWDAHLISLIRLKQWQPKAFLQLVNKYQTDIDSLWKAFQNTFCEQENWLLKATACDLAQLEACQVSCEAVAQIDSEFTPKGQSRSIIPQLFSWYSYDVTLFYTTIDLLFTLPGVSCRYFTYFQSEWKTMITHILHFKCHGVKGLREIQLTARQDPHCLALWNSKIEPIIKKDLTAELSVDDVNCLIDKYLRKKLQMRIAKNMQPFQKRLERFKLAFDSKVHVEFDAEAKDFIQHPFPMLIASTKVKSANETNSEFSVPQVKLGKDVDMIFVPSEYLLKVQNWLIKHNLNESVHIASTQHFECTSHLPLVHANSQVYNKHFLISAEDHAGLVPAIREIATPIYQKSYPDGSKREHHGPAHAARVYVFATVLSEMYHDKGIPFGHSLQNLLLAAFLHDSARENDRQDLWDEQSGEMCKTVLMRHLHISAAEADHFRYCIAHKDCEKNVSLEQKIIHAADCMDIVRCLHHPSDFIADRLWILGDLPQDEVFQFISESKTLIALTEKKAIKEWLANAANPIEALLQAIVFANIYKKEFYLLKRSMYNLIKVYGDKTQYLLTKEIEQEILA